MSTVPTSGMFSAKCQEHRAATHMLTNQQEAVVQVQEAEDYPIHHSAFAHEAMKLQKTLIDRAKQWYSESTESTMCF